MKDKPILVNIGVKFLIIPAGVLNDEEIKDFIEIFKVCKEGIYLNPYQHKLLEIVFNHPHTRTI